MKKTLAVILALVLCFACASAFAETVKIGVVGSTNEQWTDVLVPMLAEEGIDIELVYFSDYVMPNIALATGETDLNAFQHYNFMNKWNDENSETYGGVTLVAIGETLIAPLSLYSDKITSVDEIKEGDSIILPNDVVNESRALAILQTLGLIKLSEDFDTYATILDVVENPLGLNFIELSADMIGSQLSDNSVAAGFMNGQYATQAGYSHDDALAVEEFDASNESQKGIINVIAARAEDAENPTYLRIAEAYQCDEVKEVFDTLYYGSFVAAWASAEEAAD